MAQLTFENPMFLWLLLTLPFFWFVHFYWLRHTKRKAMKFANFRVLKRITGHKLITRNYTVLAVRTLILVLAIIVTSQAVYWYEGEANDNAFVLAIDTSASMRAEDILPDRLSAAKEYAGLLVDAVDSQTSFAVLSFSGVTFIEQTLTTDRRSIRSTIDDIQAIDAGGTDIPGALITSANLLVGTDKGKAIILITDGSNTLETFASQSLQQALDYVLEQKAIVYTIGVGTESAPIGYLPSYYNISGVYNEETLLYIANQTGGLHVAATTRDDLLEAYETIAGESQVALIRLDLAPYTIVLILVLLLLEWGLINTRFRSIP